MLVTAVQVILGIFCGFELELEEGCFDVSWHGDAQISVYVVTLECEAKVFLSVPVLGDLVILPEGFEQVIGVCLPCVLDPKIIDDEGKTRSDVWWRQRDGVCGTGAYPFLARFLVSRSLASRPS